MNIDIIKHHEAGKFEDTRFEKIHNVVFNDSKKASKIVAQEISNLILEKATLNKKCVLGLATGSSPISVYEELVRLHKEEGLSFKNVITFNLDEYYPMAKENTQSYWYFMHQHLFDHIDILPENINIPIGTIAQDKIQQYCIDYDRKIESVGGLDFQLLGIGRTGHIGFNEPGSHYNSGTRNITLDHITRVDAASAFLGIDNVPRVAITMGISTIRKAKRIVLLAWGLNKAIVVKKAVEGEINSEIPSSYLQNHENCTFVLDQGASQELTRINTPWLVKQCNWNDESILKAAVWLSDLKQKSILKLTDTDYNNNGMSNLLVEYGSAYNLNIILFNKLQHTITGWPGGKPNADDANRPERKSPSKKRVIIFSPHPGDDVICMGGTIDRLVEQNHEVHIAYQTSGNIAVTDEDTIKFAEVAQALNGNTTNSNKIIRDISNKEVYDIDTIEVRKLKSLIRQKESIASTRYLNILDENVHFLELPFYETGKPKKNRLEDVDISIMNHLISKIKPHQIYASEDIADPHSTHRICLDSLFLSLNQLKNEKYMSDCRVWLYRGAWQGWDIHDIKMTIPMSPDQVLRKRQAIFYHQSQKSGALFQGDNSKEFWIQIEDRNRETAKKYNALGLADYEALEAFRRYHF